MTRRSGTACTRTPASREALERINQTYDDGEEDTLTPDHDAFDPADHDSHLGRGPMKGSVYRRCGCREPGTRRPPRPAVPRPEEERGHGGWYFRYDAPGFCKVRQGRRPGSFGPFETKKARRGRTDRRTGPPSAGGRPRSPTGAFLVRDYLGHLAGRERSSGSSGTPIPLMSRACELYFKPGVGHLRLVELRDRHLQDLVTAMTQINQPLLSEAGIRVVPLFAHHRRGTPHLAQGTKSPTVLGWGPDWPGRDRVFTRERRARKCPASGTSTRFRDPRLPCRVCPPVRFHDLRHGTASLLKAAGVDTKIISTILGHAPEATSPTGSTFPSSPKVAAAGKPPQRTQLVPRGGAGR